MGCCGSSSHNDFLAHYSIGAKIGEGAFAQVRDVKHKKSKAVHAVKIIDLRAFKPGVRPSQTLDKELYQDALLEKAVWDRVGDHENCVKLYETFFIDGLCYMVMEKCGLSLMAKLEEMFDCKEQGLADISRQVLDALRHVHSCEIVHRDVKPDNFLFGGPDSSTVKLCDFGLAKFMPKRGLMRGVAGTAPYMSPEMLRETGYDGATDVWSLGVTVYVILYGEFPYMPEHRTADAMKEAIRRDHPPPLFARQSAECGEPTPAARQFSQMLLRRNPAARATIRDALNADFLQDHSNEAESASLSKVLSNARRHTKEYKVKMDPTVQKGLDELLDKLYRQSSFRRSFSADGAEEMCTDASLTVSETSVTIDHRITTGRRKERLSTHSGVYDSSSLTFTFKPAERNMEDASTCSGGSTDGSFRSPFPSPKSMNDILNLQDDGLMENYNPIGH